MNIEDLTKEQIEEMSDDELLVWHQVLEHKNQVAQIRRAMLNFVDVRDAKRKSHRIHVESEVVDNS